MTNCCVGGAGELLKRMKYLNFSRWCFILAQLSIHFCTTDREKLFEGGLCHLISLDVYFQALLRRGPQITTIHNHHPHLSFMNSPSSQQTSMMLLCSVENQECCLNTLAMANLCTIFTMSLTLGHRNVI